MSILHRFKTLFPAKHLNATRQLSIGLELSLIGALSALVWFKGPSWQLGESLPLASTEKRLYLILFFFLLWVLKFIILDAPHAFNRKDAITRKKLKALQSRFYGVLQFLKQTTVTRHGERTQLNRLPWYLLVGPSNAGKTSLLANANIHYVLQRQFQANETQNIAPSEQADWWITRDTNIVDVPGKYLAIPTQSKSAEDNPALFLTLWRNFLRLLKKTRGKNPIEGIIIALPLPEIMKHGDPKKYQLQLKHLFLRIAEIQAISNKPLTCNIVITKCDQLSGFNEFFAEANDEEVVQSWGISLPKPKANEKIQDLLIARFDMLVKKLNQQLLFRLHQERNPMARPLIKDFPLQVERLKECLLDFIKKFVNADFSLAIQGIYLTSALQTQPTSDAAVIDQHSNERALQLFKEPKALTRPYFVKQFLLQGLTPIKQDSKKQAPSRFKKGLAYSASLGAIAIAALIFGKDFEVAVKQAYTVQNNLSEYQLVMQKTHDANEQLAETITLLNHLQQTANSDQKPLSILNFYSNKSKQKSTAVYHRALKNILIPEVKNFLGDYLRNPVNKNSEQVYSALKAYLMLGDPSHLQINFIQSAMLTITAKTLTADESQQLMQHLNTAFSINKTPLQLDNTLVAETRKYLSALPNFQLGFVILKNINSNLTSAIDLENHNNIQTAFNTSESIKKIPTMFTAKAFSNIYVQDSAIAAEEATVGNWVLGANASKPDKETAINILLQQLRTTYITNYVNTWENLLSSIRLTKPQNLSQTDALIVKLVSNDSPLLQLLQTLHDNTYFDPIASASPKLHNIGLLVDKNNEANNLLYQIFSGLQTLHQYLNTIISAENERKAAFEALSARMSHTGNPDIITQLRMLADKSPEPMKSWLNKITNDSLRFMMQDATRYIDLSWEDQVSRTYETEIANHYPFSVNATQEVALNKFTQFFGNPGTLISFYDNYLSPFVDTSSQEWHWKTIDNQKLPFSEETLHQIQTAMNIHHMFFPNGDDKIHVQFSLQPYELGVKSVRLRINAKNITDQAKDTRTSHQLTWPNNNDSKMTSVQLTLNNQKKLNRDYPGDWGWFKLINQSLVNSVTNKEMLINFSEQEYPVKYLLFTQSKRNPFLSANLQALQLPKQLLLKSHEAT